MKKAKVLQGLNLLSETSTVIIETKETEDLKNLLDLINSFHPIFIEKYYFIQDYLYIQTEIPFLWRDSTETIINLSNGEIDYEEAKEYMLGSIINLAVEKDLKLYIPYPLVWIQRFQKKFRKTNGLPTQ